MKRMEVEQEEIMEPMSPAAQYLRSSALSLTILAVFEFQVPIDDPLFIIPLIKHVFLPTNSRFSSIMVKDEKGLKKWKKVEVNIQEHVYTPTFPSNMTVDYYEEGLKEYITKLAMEQLPQSKPLWEIHVLKYPTKNAAGNLIFKLHHSLGDGYSLMGTLFSCFQRFDNPSLPLTFPSRGQGRSDGRGVPRLFKCLVHSVVDFGKSLIKSSLMKDDKSPIRSGEDGVEFKPVVTTTLTFSINQLKMVKSRLGVTINDVVTGLITFAIRLYMEEIKPGSAVAKSTALALLNTRGTGAYKSVDEMIRPDSEMPWGNRFAFLQVPVPELTKTELQNPLRFIQEAHQTIKRQRNSAAVYLTGQLLDFIRKIRGHDATARYISRTLRNTSLGITNIIGPVERIALANLPISGLYFFVAGSHQSLQVTIMSYVGKLRLGILVEKGFIDPEMIESCIKCAFEIICKAALES